MRLYIGSLHFNITEDMLKGISNVGKEHGQVPMSVLMESDAIQSLMPMASRLVKRYMRNIYTFVVMCQ